MRPLARADSIIGRLARRRACCRRLTKAGPMPSARTTSAEPPAASWMAALAELASSVRRDKRRTERSFQIASTSSTTALTSVSPPIAQCRTKQTAM